MTNNEQRTNNSSLDDKSGSNSTETDLKLESNSDIVGDGLTEEASVVAEDEVASNLLVKSNMPVDYTAAAKLIDTVEKELKNDEHMRLIDESFDIEYYNLLKFLVGEENFNNTDVKNDLKLKEHLNNYLLSTSLEDKSSPEKLKEHLNLKILIVNYLKDNYQIKLDTSLFAEKEFFIFVSSVNIAAREKAVIISRIPEMSLEQRKQAAIAYRSNRELFMKRARGDIDDETYRKQYAKNYSAVYGKDADEKTIDEAIKILKEVLIEDKEEVTEGDPDFEEAIANVENNISDTNLEIDIDKDSGHAVVKASDEYSYSLKITRTANSNEFIFYIRDESSVDGVVGPFNVDEMAIAIDQRHMDSYLSDQINEISSYSDSINDIKDDSIINIASKVLLNPNARSYIFDDRSIKYLNSLAKLLSLKDSKYTSLSSKIEDLKIFLDNDSSLNYLRNQLENESFTSLSELITSFKADNPDYS